MKPKTIMVLDMCIETGVNLGYSRAYKHTDTPSEDTIKSHIINAINNEIAEWFEFDENNTPN